MWRRSSVCMEPWRLAAFNCYECPLTKPLNPPNCPGHFDIRFSLFLVLLLLVVLGGNWAGWAVVVGGGWREQGPSSNAQGGFRLPLTPSVFDSVAAIGVICGAGRNYIIIPFAPQLGKRTNESTKPTQLYTHTSYDDINTYCLSLSKYFTFFANSKRSTHTW